MIKPVTVRFPEELLTWLTRQAGKETSESGQPVSRNDLIIRLLREGRKRLEGRR